MASTVTIEAIKTALQMEEKSWILYEEAASKTNNAIVKKTMLFLAEWEKQHAEKIRKLNAHLMGELEMIDLKTECSEDPMCVVKDFFSRNIDDYKQKMKGEPEDIQVYETGMEIETEGYKFYKRAAEETDDAEARQMFEWLAEEENVHYKFLEDQHSYLSDPESWNMDEEKWILEG